MRCCCERLTVRKWRAILLLRALTGSLTGYRRPQFGVSNGLSIGGMGDRYLVDGCLEGAVTYTAGGFRGASAPGWLRWRLIALPFGAAVRE